MPVGKRRRPGRLEPVRSTPAVAFALALALTAPAAAEDVQPPELLPFRLRATAAGGFVMSGDQRSFLELDLPVAEAQVRGGWIVTEFLALELGLAGGAFFSSTDTPGGLLDVTLGAEAFVTAGPARPFLSLHFGAGVTGDLVRPALRIGAGVDVVLNQELALGPIVTYGHVFEEDTPTATEDAQFLTLGLSFTYRPLAAGAPPPPPVTQRRPARRPPLVMPPPPPPAPTEELMVLIDAAAGTRPRELLVPVLFAYDSTEIVACSISALHALREHLAEEPRIRVLEIEGHADGNGSDEYNDALSLRRAEAIRDWLIAHGVERERLQVTARGERAPIEANDEDAGREQNRRVRFRVIREDQ